MTDAEFGRQVSRRVVWRLIPILGLAYILGQIDRVNVSFAALTMNRDLGFSEGIYGLGAGLFFIGYVLFQIPSNLLLERIGARRLLAVIMIVWGGLSAATAFVTTANQFYVMRLLLGAAESGLYPGALLYLTYWFGERDRASAVAWFSLAVPVAGVLGSPVSGWILEGTGDWGLFAGWQWLFLLEGLPSIAMALVVFAYLTDRPEQASWLTADEKAWLASVTTPPTPRWADPQPQATGWLESLRPAWHPSTIKLAITYFCFAGALVGSLYWIPKLFAQVSPTLGKDSIGWLVAGPYLLFGLGSVYWGRHSDRTGERRWHVVGALSVATIGLATAALANSIAVAMTGVCLLMLGGGAGFSTFWGTATHILAGRPRGVGIATVNILGSFSSFATIYVCGLLIEHTGGYFWSFSLLAATAAAGALLTIWAIQGDSRT